MHSWLPRLALPQTCCWLNLSSGDASPWSEPNHHTSGAGITKSDIVRLWERENVSYSSKRALVKQILSLTKPLTTSMLYLKVTEHKPWSHFLKHLWWWRYRLPNACMQGKERHGAWWAFPHQFCYGTFIMGRSLSKFNGGSKASLYYTDMMINICTDHSRLTLNSLLHQQSETWPAWSGPSRT